MTFYQILLLHVIIVGKPKWHRSFTDAAECKYEYVHTELVQVFYDFKWIRSGAFDFEKKTIKKNLKIYPGTQKKPWYVKCKTNNYSTSFCAILLI